MTTKYGYLNVRDQLVRDLKDAYPTKWRAYQAAGVLGEDVFGSPRPHPNAVLHLFLEQNIRFALPFAAYRASINGFSALMNDEPGMALPRHALATTTYGMHLLRVIMGKAARVIAYEGNLGVCAKEGCVLGVRINSNERRMETLIKLHAALLLKKVGGELGPLSLGHLTCAKCTKGIQQSHTAWRSACWERLPSIFSIAQSWDKL